MRPAFIALVVVVHLLCDLASPFSGAFRFNPYESVDGVRAEEIQAEALERAVDPSARPALAGLPRGVFKIAAASAHPRSIPRGVTLFPRRHALSSDGPSPPTDDH